MKFRVTLVGEIWFRSSWFNGSTLICGLSSFERWIRFAVQKMCGTKTFVFNRFGAERRRAALRAPPETSEGTNLLTVEIQRQKLGENSNIWSADCMHTHRESLEVCDRRALGASIGALSSFCFLNLCLSPAIFLVGRFSGQRGSLTELRIDHLRSGSPQPFKTRRQFVCNFAAVLTESSRSLVRRRVSVSVSASENQPIDQPTGRIQIQIQNFLCDTIRIV